MDAQCSTGAGRIPATRDPAGHRGAIQPELNVVAVLVASEQASKVATQTCMAAANDLTLDVPRSWRTGYLELSEAAARAPGLRRVPMAIGSNGRPTPAEGRHHGIDQRGCRRGA